MRDERNPVPALPRVPDWARTLPPYAAEIVDSSDIAQPHVYLQLSASADQLAVIRSEVTDWTRQLGVDDTTRQDIVLAVDEAAANAIEHAYPGDPGTVTLLAAYGRASRMARIVVSDTGTWRPQPVDSGTRGRGLAMMKLLTDLFKLCHDPHGTTIVLGWLLPA
jgi:serine/threonine-protein kinase RsbW